MAVANTFSKKEPPIKIPRSAPESPFYIASVVLLKLHGCVVNHMQVLATTLLSVHNLLNTHLTGPLQLKEFNFSYLFLRQ